MTSVRPLIVAGLLLLVLGCGGDRVEVATTIAKNDGSSKALTPEEATVAFTTFARRAVSNINDAANQIDAHAPDNATKRQSLLWRIRVAESCRQARHRANWAVGLIELWFWAAAMDVQYSTGGDAKTFGAQQPLAIDVVHKLRLEAESLVRRSFPGPRFAELKAEVDGAASRGELFSAGESTQRAVLTQLLDLTHLETLLSLPLAPFAALQGVGKGSDALGELVVVGERALDLAETYPQTLTWHLRLLMLEIEEQDTTRAARMDFNRITKTMEELADTVKELPARLRAETEAILAGSRELQAPAQETLKRTADAASALERAAQASDALVKSVDAAFVHPPGAAPAAPAPTQGAAEARVFDIREYTAAVQAAEVTVRETRAAVESLRAAVASPEVDARVKALVRETDASIDRAFWRALQALLVAAVLGLGLIIVHHRLRRRS
jgi:hypothetical protein